MASNPYNQAGAVASGGFKTYSAKAVKAGNVNPYNSPFSGVDPYEEQKQRQANDAKQFKQNSSPQLATKSQPPPKSQSLFSKITSTASKVGKTAEQAGAAVVKPVADVVTGKGGKAAHDTAQLTSDVTGGTVNQFAKGIVNTPIAIKREIQNKPITDIQKNAFGTTNPGQIGKKIIGSTGGAITMLAGGGEAAGLKSLLTTGAKRVAAKQIAKDVGMDATIGATGNAAATLTNNPNATPKQLLKSGIVGGAIGGVVPVAAKGAGVAASKIAGSKAGQSILEKVDNVKPNIQATKDLVTNTKTKALLGAVEPTKTAGVDTITKSVVNTLMSKLHTPKSVLEDAKAQADNAVATQKANEKAAIQTQKDTETGQKLDNQIELINAKKADGKFSNVDKVKIEQLKQQKQDLGIPQTSDVPTAEAPTTKAPVANTKAADEQFAHDYLANNRPQAEADYAARTAKEFNVTKNNIVSGDEAKFVIPGFGPDKSVPYHNAASQFAKDHYKSLLADESTKDKPVMITAGGSGAGKTSALRQYAHEQGETLDDFAAIVDTNLTDMKGAQSRIEAARATGRPVDINYVYRDPKEAYANGVIPRAVKTGRVVTDKIHAETHVGSLDTIKKLVEKYKHDPDVNVNVIDNSNGKGSHTVIPEAKVLDFLNSKSYNKEQVHADVHEALNSAVKNGEITHEQKNNFIHDKTEQQSAGAKERPSNGQKPQEPVRQPKTEVAPKVSARKQTEYNPKKGEPVNVPIEQPKVKQPEIKQSKLASSTEQKAIDKKLTQGFGGKPEYAKVNIKDQARAAVELLKADPEKSTRIALGQELPPEHLLPESVYVAVENKALKEGNVDLLRRLATEGSLSSEATGMGQRISMLASRDPDSAVTAMRQLSKTRKEVAEKRLGKPITKAVNEEVRTIRANKPIIKKETWNSFVTSLAC